GVKVMLLEAHKDFERDFRGDTVHASTVALLDQLGLHERMLQLPHTAGYDFPMHFPDGSVTPPPKPGKRRVSYSIKQSALLDRLFDEAGRSPTFRLVMGARVEDLVLENGVVRGVRYRAADG